MNNADNNKEKNVTKEEEAHVINPDIYDLDVTFKSIGVCEEICEVLQKIGYKHPSKIQRESLPYALQGRDVIGLAETGSGKTAAFGIPIIQKLLSEEPKPFYACIMAPTRELCLQINHHLETLGSTVGLKTCVLVGGLDNVTQAIALSKNPHIIVGTPGRVVDHLTNTKGFTLKNLKFLVFDEADRLLDLDFEKQIHQLLSVVPKTRTTFLFSATMTSKVHKLQKACLTDPIKVEVNSKYTTVSTLVQNYIFIPAKFKETYLGYLINQFAGNSVIIFVSTCLNSIQTTLILRHLGFKAIAINGKMTQGNRIGALNKFRSGERNILVATDVASRGLDIPNVDLVINYDLPQQTKDYIHRVGRTARAGKSGRSITFVTQYDVENYQKIEHLIEKKMDLYDAEENKVLQLHERVLEGCRFAKQEIKEIAKKLKTSDVIESNPDNDHDEGDNYESFLHNKRKMDKDKKDFRNKSFVKKRKVR
jgi:ATP-dependent RNA helicase DDX47/RRP3